MMGDNTKPEGWENCKFGDIAKIRNGYAFKSNLFKKQKTDASDVPLLRQSQLKGSHVDLRDAVYLESYLLREHENYIIGKGDILIGMSGSIGRVCLYDEENPALQNQRTGKIEPFTPDQIDAHFFGLYLSSVERKLVEYSKGMGVQNISAKDIEGLLFFLPPFNEQRRIVAKIEELFSELDKGVESLKTIREQLKIYRQAVLKHAFEGKLTANWREENKDKLEPAEKLLERIKTERETRDQHQLDDWGNAVKKWEVKGKDGKKPAKPKKLAQLPELSLEEKTGLAQLPNGWVYSRVGLLIDEPKYGTSKKCDYEFDGLGVLRIPNIVSGLVDDSDLKFASFDDDEILTYGLKENDILIIRSNGSISIVGKCALISKHEEQYLYAGYLIRLRSNSQLASSKYLLALLSSHLLRSQIEAKAKSTSGVNNINSGELQSLIVPVCSLEEQSIIVGEISAALSSIDNLENEIENQIKRSEALRQSILKKAFSGQLVPQDQNDEPASVLLERIRAGKAAQVKNKPKRKIQKRKDAA